MQGHKEVQIDQNSATKCSVSAGLNGHWSSIHLDALQLFSETLKI
jgi:hypothetical protein